jgi:hypothetical protein
MGINKVIHGNEIKPGAEFVKKIVFSHTAKQQEKNIHKKNKVQEGPVSLALIDFIRNEHEIENKRNRPIGHGHHIKKKADAVNLEQKKQC